jgi:hypothetical protein
MHTRKPQFSDRMGHAALSSRLWLTGALVSVVLGFAQTPVSADGMANQETEQVLTLVELYTSQGCSSCPPADAFLSDLAERSDVLALSFHVDYWNTDEWQDPFSHKSFSLRQRAYKESLKTDYVYTPQMVVAGSYAAPGGQRLAINDAIAQTTSGVGHPELSIRRMANDRVEITVSAVNNASHGTVYAAVYDSQKYTRVRGGENRGRTLSNINVVKRLVALAPYSGKAQKFGFAVSDLDALRSDGIAVFIQAEKVGRVLSVANLSPRAVPSVQVTLTQLRQPTLR